MQQRWVLSVGLSSLIAVSLCMFAAEQVQAVNGNGPYYAEPAWSQRLPATTRFIVLTDWGSQAVLDRETGLVWEQAPGTTGVNWVTARSICANKAIGGRKGWRLPSLFELASLLDPAVAAPGPTLPPGHPFSGIQSLVHWTATTNAEVPANAWDVNFFTGGVSFTNKILLSIVWCVHGGMSGEAY